MPKEPMKKPNFTKPSELLLDKMGGDTKHLLDPARGVYANRNLNLQKIDLIGFDMDYTLAIYKKLPMEQLQYDLTLDRLIKEHQYPQEIAELKYDASFIIRGLLVDKHTGHLLKINSHNRVKHACFGRRQLLESEIEAYYHNEKIRLSDARFASLDTLFAMPEACLFANLVDFFQDLLLRSQNVAPVTLQRSDSPCEHVGFDTEKLFCDVRDSIDAIHRDGSLKTIITDDISTYIEEDPDLPLMLHKFRSSGKKIFLLTNSYWAYTQKVMEYLLDDKLQAYPDWQSYFDIAIVGGKKPGFFGKEVPFIELDTSQPGDGVGVEEEVTQFERGKIYQGGNIKDFERMVNVQGAQVLYVGDHIYGDILRSRKDSLWRTCLIVEELEQEIHGVMRWAFDVEKLSMLDSERQETDTAIGRHRALLARMESLDTGTDGSVELDLNEEEELKQSIKNLTFEIDHAKRYLKYIDGLLASHTDELERRFNPYWGRLLKEHNDLSRFGAQVVWFACTYTSRASNFLRYSPVHRYKASRDSMSHDYILQESSAMRQVRQSKLTAGTLPPRT